MTRFGWEGDHQHRSNTPANSVRRTNVDLGLVIVGEKVVEIINSIVAVKHGALYGGTKKPARQVEFPRNFHGCLIVGLQLVCLGTTLLSERTWKFSSEWLCVFDG